jgi:hypothetical protein
VLGGAHQQAGDVEHVKRQIEELQKELDKERSTTGAVIE